MAAVKSTSVKALARLRAEREAFDNRERDARRDAAIELGEAVLKAADLALDPVQVSDVMAAVLKHGFDGAMALLMPPASGRKSPATAAPALATDHVG
ncbi:hypothetical protein GCM10007973_02170 [Polymorphobacter multimanifer]|uniref:DUF64370 domain-containing protein n=1 Tax=Polymorphobacter multimanifer TaxID=1070431 RepID=A0A841L6L1_9SPHN|nr:DUF6437 family protein [Polymorphobacter multimanifer]MBB6228599.1 hypothetical protein [Polymorphobacter multimanifer]GGI68652.1 hypothetical protein GCM10007973_02170 [Polymorphobacter multimanifer]